MSKPLYEYLVRHSSDLKQEHLHAIFAHRDTSTSDWVMVFKRSDIDKVYRMACHYEQWFGKKWINFGDHYFEPRDAVGNYWEDYVVVSYWPAEYITVDETDDYGWKELKKETSSQQLDNATIHGFIKYAQIPETVLRIKK